MAPIHQQRCQISNKPTQCPFWNTFELQILKIENGSKRGKLHCNPRKQLTHKMINGHQRLKEKWSRGNDSVKLLHTQSAQSMEANEGNLNASRYQMAGM